MLTLDGSATTGAVCLSVFLLWAAIAKIRNPDSTAAEFRQLGLPSFAFRLVPGVEIALAAALLLIPSWGGVFAFFLLAAFSSILFTIIRSGSGQSCSCFGQASRGPVRSIDLLRNGVLLGLSILASTIDRLETPQIGDIVSIGGLSCLVALSTVVPNRSQPAPHVANASQKGYKGDL